MIDVCCVSDTCLQLERGPQMSGVTVHNCLGWDPVPKRSISPGLSEADPSDSARETLQHDARPNGTSLLKGRRPRVIYFIAVAMESEPFGFCP